MSTISASTTSTTAYKVTADTTGTLVLQTGSTPTTAMTIDTSQNVGIGTSSPSTKLHLYGATDQRIRFENTGWTKAYQIGNDQNALSFYDVTAAVERMRIDSSGNVGIGTSSPGTKLEINTGSSYSGVRLKGTSSASTGFEMTLGSNGKTGYLWNYENDSLLFATNNTERARIDSGGNFYIGATGQVVNTYLLTLHYSGNASKGGILFNDTDSGQTYEACYFRKDGAQRGYIRVTTTGTTYATVSDYRLKENVQPMSGALAKIAVLKPCTYTWKDSGIHSQGFVAHELAEVVPECVTGEKDAVDEDGNPKYQGIDTSFLVATLTAAIQEQQAIITQLQSDVAALKGQA